LLDELDDCELELLDEELELILDELNDDELLLTLELELLDELELDELDEELNDDELIEEKLAYPSQQTAAEK